jgi:hypothetical protein
VLLNEGAFKRLAGWLETRDLPVMAEELSVKGFDAAVSAYRVRRPDYAGRTPAAPS